MLNLWLRVHWTTASKLLLCALSSITCLAVIPSLSHGAANILKEVIPSTTCGTNSMITFPLLCNKQVVNHRVAAMSHLAMPHGS